MLNVAWGQTTKTYTFTSKSWAATCNNETANWTSGKDGSGFTSGQGTQVTSKVSGANATSPEIFSNVSKIIVTYCTNKSSGKGAIKLQVGSNSEQSFNVSAPSSDGTSLKTKEFTYSSYQSGNVKITVNCTDNSIYIYSIAITASDDPYINVSSTTIEAGYEGVTNGTLSYTSNKIRGYNIVYYEADGITPKDNDWNHEWFSATPNTNGTISYNIAENTGEARTLYFKVEGQVNGTSAEEFLQFVYSDLITVTQAAAPSKLTIPWVEDFSGDNPLSKYIVSLASTRNENYAKGEAPELMISNSGGNKGFLTATFDLEGYSGYLTLTFKSNYFDYLSVTCVGCEVSTYVDDQNNKFYFINVPERTNTLTLTVKNEKSGQNARVDDFNLIKGKIQTPANLSYSKESFSAYIGETNEFPVLSNEYNLPVTYSSSNTNVATIDENGNVTLVAKGATTITATYQETNYFFAGQASYTLIVKQRGELITYKKVTSTDEITDGNYLIVYEEGSVALDGNRETLDAVNNTTEVTLNNSKITAPETAAFTIDITNGTKGTLKSSSGYYIGVSSSNSNGLNQSNDATAYENSFTIDGNGNAVIAAVLPSGNMTLRYNKTNNQNRFRYYSSGQQPIQLYKEVVEEPVTATFNPKYKGFTSIYYSDKNLKVPANVTAHTYKVVEGKGEYITDIKAEGVIPHGTPVILEYGGTFANNTDPVEVTFEEVASAEPLNDGNMLRGSDQVGSDGKTTGPEAEENYYFYVLSVGQGEEAGKIGFYWKVDGGAAFIPTPHKVYLALKQSDVPGVNASMVSISDTNGINSITANNDRSQDVYTLSGIRMNGKDLPKGIYIIGGKKVVVK